MGYLLYQLGAGFLPSTVLRIQIRSTVGIPGKHDLRLAGEKAIDFQRWPLEAADFGVSMVWIFAVLEWWWFLERVMVIRSLISHGTPRNLGCFRIVCMFFPMGLQRAIWDFSRLQKLKGKLTAIAIAAINMSSKASFVFWGSDLCHPRFIPTETPRGLLETQAETKGCHSHRVEPGNARQPWADRIGCFVGGNHHQIMSFNRSPWVWHGCFVFFQMHGVGAISTDSIFMPAGFILLIYEAALYWGLYKETKLSFPPLKGSPPQLGLDSQRACDRRCPVGGSH